MGWFSEELAYKLAPLFGPVGKGIADHIQDIRLADAVKAYDAAPNLAKFSEVPEPQGIYSPEHLKVLQASKLARQGVLQANEAAPVAKMLANFTAEGNDADPNFSGAEWVKGMATTPALGGPMSEADYDALRTGAVPGGKKGAVPLSTFAANPISASLIQNAETNAQNKGTLARAFADGPQANPMDLATVAMNKDLSSGFHQTNQGTNLMDETTNRQTERTNKATDRDQAALADRLVNFLDTKTYGYNGADGWVKPMDHLNQVVDAASADFTSPEALKRLDKFKTDVGKQWDKRVYDWSKPQTIGTGNATKKFQYATNPMEEEIPGTRIEVTSHPPAEKPQREKLVQTTMDDGNGNAITGTLNLDTNVFTPAKTTEGKQVIKPKQGKQKPQITVDPVTGKLVVSGTGAQKPAAATPPMTATNPQTGQRIISHDNGASWQAYEGK